MGIYDYVSETDDIQNGTGICRKYVSSVLCVMTLRLAMYKGKSKHSRLIVFEVKVASKGDQHVMDSMTCR